MKKSFMLIIFFALILSSCAAAKPEAQEKTEAPTQPDPAEREAAEAEISASEHLVGYDGAGDFACDGGDALYFITQAYSHSMIVRYDKAAGAGEPLCKKEGCTHDEPGCEANIDSSGSGLTYHGGRLYWIQVDRDGAKICCEDVESRARAVIKSLPGDYPAVCDVIFRDGKAYYSVAHYVGNIAAKIGIADLNGGGDEVISDGSLLELSLPVNVDIRLVGEALYITSFKMLNNSDPDSDISFECYKYDVSGGELSEILNISSAAGDIPKAKSVKLINENELLFMSAETGKFCSYNVAEKTYSELFDFPESGSQGGKIRYCGVLGDIFAALEQHDGKTAIIAKNPAGETIFVSDLSEFFGEEGGVPSCWIAGRDGENIYICYTYQDTGYTYQLNKTVAAPLDGSAPKLLFCNRSSLLRRWN